MNKISFSIIGKNEEKYIRDCLESIKDYAYEIIFVDTGSTDKTLDIVKEYTDKIYYFEWCDDFASARNYGLQYCTGDWIFYIDCDEGLRGDITKLFNKPEIDVWYFNQVYPNRVNCITSRMFKRGLQFKGKIHESLELKEGLKLGRCNIVIEHCKDFQTVSDLQKKKEYYMNLLKTEDNELKRKYYEGLNALTEGNANKSIQLFKELIDYADKTMKPYLISIVASIYYEIYKIYETAFIELTTKSITIAPNQITGYISLLNYYNSHNDRDMVIKCLNKIKENNASKTTLMQNDITLTKEEEENLFKIFLN